MITIVTNNCNNKLKYTLDYIFVERLGLTYSICKDIHETNSSDNIIYYSNDINNNISIFNSGFLSQTEITPFEPNIKYENDKIYLFHSKDFSHQVNFDIFAATFYLLSRYEEYLPHKKDIHQRFDIGGSFAYKHKFHQRAIIDEWICDFREFIIKNFPKECLKKEDFSYQLTVDIDIAYSFLHKGLIRFIGGATKDFIKLNFINLAYRFSTLFRITKDPYLTFDFLKEIETKTNIPIQYFVLVAKTKTKYDKNNKRQNKAFRCLIKQLSVNKSVGLHPSYFSNNNNETLIDEKNTLTEICGYEIKKTRQHYLRLKFPDTYNNIIKAGFTDDYTMGFASNYGYRAGTSRPFKFYNLKTDKATELIIHPFSIMDGSLKDYLNLDNENVAKIISEQISYLKKINGHFTFLMHNETMSESKRWKGWQKIVIGMIDELKTNNK